MVMMKLPKGNQTEIKITRQIIGNKNQIVLNKHQCLNQNHADYSKELVLPQGIKPSSLIITNSLSH